MAEAAPGVALAAPDPTSPQERFAPPLTTIIATIGPASRTPEVAGRLIDHGAAIFRLNFSHGTLEEHAETLEVLRDTAADRGRVVAVMGDLPGAKIRLAGVGSGGVDLPTGSEVTIVPTPDGSDASRRRLATTYDGLSRELQPGHRVLIDDGTIRMLAVEAGDDGVRCTVTMGGTAGDGKGVNLPDTDLGIPVITARDRECARWAVEHELDFLAQSFVGGGDDVRELRAIIDEARGAAGTPELRMPIIAKIERPAAVGDVGDILGAADAIMVARGDLGVEMDPARVPVIQKQLVGAARRYGRPCIVATQMLQSMTGSPTPTRAEASDVANAIFDGADAVMLSGETAVGRYPVPAVDAMRRIAEATERYLNDNPPADEGPPEELLKSRSPMAALAHAAWTIARHVDARLVVAWSQAGGGARYLSRHRFRVPIIAVSSDERALRQMQLLRGVFPVRMAPPGNVGGFTRLADEHILELGWAKRGDAVVLMAGEPLGKVAATTTVAYHRLGDPDTGYARFGA